MIKPGQIYKEINAPQFRKPNAKPFLITHVYFTSASILYPDGKTSSGGLDWIKGDCELIKEFSSWEEAITSKEFKS